MPQIVTKHIAIVVPVFREERNIPQLYQRLEQVTGGMSDFSWEYIFVNDGSPDDSLETLRRLAAADRKVKVIDLSRNFGKEIAMTAGVHHAVHADAVICLDADLQHPPEYIPELVAKWQTGVDVVATIRVSIERQPLARRIGSFLYYWLMAKISEVEMVAQTTDFRLFDRKVVEAFCALTERERMFRGMIDWMGFRKEYVEFRADAREVGEAGYSYRKLWRLALGSITSFSLFPLKLTGYLGIFITLFAGLLLTWMMVTRFVLDTQMFTPLAFFVVANTLLIGIVLMAIGLVALYIGNIHIEVINRPLYLTREKLNFEESRVDRSPEPISQRSLHSSLPQMQSSRYSDPVSSARGIGPSQSE